MSRRRRRDYISDSEIAKYFEETDPEADDSAEDDDDLDDISVVGDEQDEEEVDQVQETEEVYVLTEPPAVSPGAVDMFEDFVQQATFVVITSGQDIPVPVLTPPPPSPQAVDLSDDFGHQPSFQTETPVEQEVSAEPEDAATLSDTLSDIDQLPSPERDAAEEPQRKKQRLQTKKRGSRGNTRQRATVPARQPAPVVQARRVSARVQAGRPVEAAVSESSGDEGDHHLEDVPARQPSQGVPAQRVAARVQAPRPVEAAISDSSGAEDERNLENNPDQRPVLLRRRRFVKRRDRAVHSLATALDDRNYDPIPPRTAPHEIHHMKVTADRQRNRPARDIKWSTKPPPTRRRGPQDITSKPEKISAEAEAAETTADFWSLFFPSAIIDKIVEYTNEKIVEYLERSQYTDDQLRKKPHVKTLDQVELLVTWFGNGNFFIFFYTIGKCSFIIIFLISFLLLQGYRGFLYIPVLVCNANAVSWHGTFSVIIVD